MAGRVTGRPRVRVLGSRVWLLPAGGALHALYLNMLEGRWWWCAGNLLFAGLWLWLAKPRPRTDLWVIPRVPHVHRPVGPRLLPDGWIRREAGTSTPAHTRVYAQQLLAAADAADALFAPGREKPDA